MTACNWLNIWELGKFHSMITTWKLVYLNIPKNLADKITSDDNHNIGTSIPRLQNTKSSFRWKCIDDWNNLPQELKNCPSLPRFKVQLRRLIISSRVQNPQVQHLDDTSDTDYTQDPDNTDDTSNQRTNHYSDPDDSHTQDDTSNPDDYMDDWSSSPEEWPDDDRQDPL